MKLRHSAALAAFVAAGLVLSACSGGTTSSSSKSGKSITLLTSWTKGDSRRPALNKMLATFTKQTGIKVTVSSGGNEGGSLDSVYEADVLAGNEPDLILESYEAKAVEWADQGSTEDVKKYISDWGLSSTIPSSAVEEWTTTSGKVAGLPYLELTWPWWYNMALFKKVGVTTAPTTVDELIADSKKLSAAGIPTFTTGGSDWSGEKVFAQIVQSYMSAKEAQSVFRTGGFCATADAMKGIDLFVKLRDSGVFVDDIQGLTSDEATAQYMDGKAAMSSMGSWSYGSASADLEKNTVLAGFPTVDGGSYSKPTTMTSSTLGGFMISPNGAKNISAVKKLVTFMYSADQLKTLTDGTGAIPVASVSSDAIAKSGNSLLSYSVTDLPSKADSVVYPDAYVPGSASDALYAATSIAFTDGKSAKQVCAAVDKAYSN